MAPVGTPNVRAFSPDDLVLLLGDRVVGAERGLDVLQRGSMLMRSDLRPK